MNHKSTLASGDVHPNVHRPVRLQGGAQHPIMIHHGFRITVDLYFLFMFSIL